jgi:hypothetical protein
MAMSHCTKVSRDGAASEWTVAMMPRRGTIEPVRLKADTTHNPVRLKADTTYNPVRLRADTTFG